MRETLFGDIAWEHWPSDGGGANGRPWDWFVAGREFLQEGKKEEAIAQLRQVTECPKLESRQYLQAWHFLRQLGVKPAPELAKHVYGVVIEVGMPNGLDLLAAYEDGSARYWNFSGAGVVWEAPVSDVGIEAALRQLLERGSAVAARIGPWEGARPPAPGNGAARLSMLTPSGIHFGQGMMNDLMGDPMAAGLINSGAHLMKLLMDKSAQQRQAHPG
jgi:hypothetical protein